MGGGGLVRWRLRLAGRHRYERHGRTMEIRNKLVNWRRRRRRRRRDLTDWAAVRDGGGQWNELGPRDNDDDDVDDVIIGFHARRRLDQDLAVVFVYSSPAAHPPRSYILCISCNRDRPLQQVSCSTRLVSSWPPLLSYMSIDAVHCSAGAKPSGRLLCQDSHRILCSSLISDTHTRTHTPV